MTPRQQAVLVGSAVTGLFTTSYLGFINSCCCLGVILGGAVAVQQYSASIPGVGGGDGALIGALSGAGGSVLGFLFNLILRPVGMDYQSISREASQEMINQMMANMQGQQGLSPELMEQLQGEGTGMLTLVGFAFLGFRILLFAIFGAIGGALGAAIFGGDSPSPNGEAPEPSQDDHLEGPTP